MRATLLLAVLGLATAAVLAAAPAGAAPPTYQDPGNVTLSASPVDGLVNGSAITFTVNAAAGVHLSGPITAHLCQHGLTGYTATNFGYSGPSATRCIYQPNITAGGLTSADYEFTSSPYNPAVDTTSGPLTFHAGAGSVTWGNVTGQGPLSLTADATHPIDLVLQVGLSGGSVGSTFIVQQLTFAGQPGAPTAVAATPGDNSAHVTWTAPAAPNGTINHYHVVATQTGGLAAPTVTFDTVGPVLAADLALQNFSIYSIAVQTVTTELPGSPSTAATVPNVNPLPPAPTGVSGAPTDGAVTVSWTAPASTSTPTAYEVTAHDSTGIIADSVQCTNSTGTSFLYTPLANGTPWTFKVRAAYGPGANCAGPSFGPFSGQSSNVVPSNVEIDQLIQVTRPTGALVLTQACDATYPRLTPGGTTRDPNYTAGDPYPQDPTTGLVPAGNLLYPTPSIVAGTPGALGTCSVNLGAAKLITGSNGAAIQPTQPVVAQSGTNGYPQVFEGQFFKADGAIHQVTVVNTRETSENWTVNGKLSSDFVDGTSDILSGTSLGWQPALTDKTPDFQTPGMATPYHNDAARGADVLPANTPAGQGLKFSQVLAQSVTHGLGEAHLDALLHILMPVTTPHGTYTALLQITAI